MPCQNCYSCHAPGGLTFASTTAHSSLGVEPGVFPRGAVEPRVPASRSPGSHSAGLPQLGTLTSSRPGDSRASELPEGPDCSLVSEKIFVYRSYLYIFSGNTPPHPTSGSDSVNVGSLLCNVLHFSGSRFLMCGKKNIYLD